VSQKTSIEWTDVSWNPVRGCSRVSEGCRHCYSEVMAARFSDPGYWGHGFAERTAAGGRWTGKVALITEKLAEPLSWKAHRRCFVNSTSDLFHEKLSFEDIAAVYGVMAACPHITFQVLTKRPERRREFFDWLARCLDSPFSTCLDAASQAIPEDKYPKGLTPGIEWPGPVDGSWPLPNVWEGTSVENQETADRRIPELLRTPAAIRFVSYEPALGPVNFKCVDDLPAHKTLAAELAHLSGYDPRAAADAYAGPAWIDSLTGRGFDGEDFSRGPMLDWIIVGGESGPGARPFDIAWARSTVDQCKEAGVAAFVKQLGGYPIDPAKIEREPHRACDIIRGEPTEAQLDRLARLCELGFVRLKDKKGGDWDEWPADLRVREFPAVPHA
jgi:protein gp37